MKKTLFIPIFIFVLAIAVFGQKLVKPTQIPTPPTAAQQKTLREGVALHDAKKYDEAIAKYRSILTENHDCTAAMYELSMTLDAKGEKEKALELANIGSKYISDELPLFYVTMANILDEKGKPQEAIKLYQEGLKLLEGDKRFGAYRASLHYNLGVTYVQQKKNNEARASLKSAVASDFNYASPHYLLSVVYNGTRYPVPAFLAASRFISLEFNTNRTGIAVGVIADVLKPAPKDPKTGNINIFLNLGGPKDEGNFAMYEIFLGTLTTFTDDKDKGKKRTENEMFIDAIGTLIDIVGEDKGLTSTFVGKNYAPFVVDLKKNGHVEAFGNMVLYIKDNNNVDAAKWVRANDTKLEAFLNWARAYRSPSN